MDERSQGDWGVPDMSMQRVGSCSICGGDVVGYRGIWMCINPPPPDKCSGCGAVAAGDVIKMSPAPQRTNAVRFTTNSMEHQ